jgi:hypothetical protein
MRTREIFPWRKRFRGAKRYYSKLYRRAERFGFPLGETDWYDMHHVHFDFSGHGRRSVKHHREHLRALFTAFGRVLAHAPHGSRPAQVFVSISPVFWPEGDALFIHTPNPNGTAFPCDFEGARWRVKPPAFLREFVSGKPWDIGVKENDGKQWFVIRESKVVVASERELRSLLLPEAQ